MIIDGIPQNAELVIRFRDIRPGDSYWDVVGLGPCHSEDEDGKDCQGSPG